MCTAGLELKSPSPERTLEWGKTLGCLIRPGDCISLEGELGAGKTLLVKGIARGAQSEDLVVSPTFNMMLEYRAAFPIRHLDAYLAGRERAFLEEACSEVFANDGIALVEWGDRVPEFLPKDHLKILIKILGPEERQIRFKASGPTSQALLDRFRRNIEARS